MKSLQKAVGFLVALMLVLFPATAFAGENDGIMTMACPEVGHHQNVTNHSTFFMTGSAPKHWLAPGVLFTGKSSEYTTVSASVSGGIDAEFLAFAKARVDGSLDRSHTVYGSATWSWQNNTNTTKWVQLGVNGHDFDYSRYDVVAPCNVVNSVKKHAKMPTNQPYYNHN